MKSSPKDRLARQCISSFIFLPIFLTFALSLLLSACAGITSQPSVKTAPTAKATLSLAPATFDFGTVQLNSVATSVVSVTNTGLSAETIDSATVLPAPIFSIQGWTGAVTVAPGQTVQLQATFAPQSAGNYSGTLTLAMQQLLVPISIPLTGRTAENSPPPIVGISVSPTSVSLQSSQSKQFTSVVTGTSNTGVTWSAVLGSIVSSGYYTAPTLPSQTIDSVSAVSVADATKYATAQVVIQGDPQNAVWTIQDQQPVTQVFYPGTVWTTPLPADTGSHLFTDSDTIVTNIFGGSDVPNFNSFTLQCLTSAQCTSSMGNGFYYASASDPVFRVNAGSAPCPSSPSATSANCAAGKYFHLPSGARYDSVPVSSANDQGLLIWDQSTDIDPTSGGRIVGSYYFGIGSRALPTTCTATTPAGADAQPACQLSWYYNSVNFPFSDPTATGDGLSSDGSPSGATFLREEEIMQNSVNHALGLDTACLRSSSGNGVADAPVFPATGNAIGCSFVDSLRPLNGSLFWIDSTYNCGALPAWQAPVCRAMQTYGGYVHATQGGSQSPLYVMPMEGGMAHTTAGVNDTYFDDWIITNGVTSCPSGAYPKVCTGANGLEMVEDSAATSDKAILYFFQMPGLITGHHLHIVDPCIPKRMAGQPGAC